VPVSGDTAVINAGTVSLESSPSGVTIQLAETSGGTSSTTLAMNSVTLDSSVALIVNNQNSYNNTAPTITVTGSSGFAGTESFYTGKVNFSIASGATLTNSGTLNFYYASPVTSGGGTLVNNGIMALVNPANAPQVPVFNDAITGTGTIALGEHARVEFTGAVASSQTILLNDGASGNEIVQLNTPSTFQGVINGFSSSDLIAVIDTADTSGTWTSTGSNSGYLTLNSTGATIHFDGSYSQSSFSFTYNNFGGGQSNLQITTTGVNQQSGDLPPGYTGGGNGATAVYRFFDNIYGTHLFTQSLAEAQQILATRPDLVQETNNFGAVSQSDPNAEAVYRFFETTNGTHFFTASYSEYLGLTTPGTSTYRPDLTYEPSSTIYEDATDQPGDVEVYRLFDTIHGTQFLTGSQTEYAGLTTPGSSTYRSDLTPEGAAFYAPSGTFHT
jgi:hypothetical protein